MDPMQKKREDLKALLKELGAFQEKVNKGEAPDQATAEAMDAKAEEAESIQAELDTHDRRMKRVRGALESGKRVADPVLPPDDEVHDATDEPPPDPGGAKAYREERSKAFAYLTMGDYVLASEGFQQFKAQGRPKQQVVFNRIKQLFPQRGREPLVPVDAKMLKAFVKAVPTIADAVIEPARVPEIVRVTEHDRLTLRDILDVQRTTGDAVRYVRITNYTRAAATVARGAQKPEAAMALDPITELVRDIAVWIPVQEQQLDDLPALAGLINGELLYDLGKHVEELVVWGDGVGENFSGIATNADVLAARTEVGDTLIDISRRGITDVRRAGYEPNGIVVDPLDWENIVLEKGTDSRYVWVVVTDGAVQRLWGVPVIESVAAEDFSGNATEERVMLVGDFARGATLWDRMDAAIMSGWINDQFIRNQRTILAEERAAFGVKRPGAFRKHQTQAPVAGS